MEKLNYHVKAKPRPISLEYPPKSVDPFDHVGKGSLVRVVNPYNNRLEEIGTVESKDLQGGILVKIKFQYADQLPEYVKNSFNELGKRFQSGFFSLAKSEYHAFFW